MQTCGRETGGPLIIVTPYQGVFFSVKEQDADTWEEMAVIADLSLHIQCMSFQGAKSGYGNTCHSEVSKMDQPHKLE